MLKLKKFPDIPVSTPEEARGSGHRQRSSVSTAKLEMRDPSLLPRERIPDVSTHLNRRRAAQERREELMGRGTIPKVPQMSQSTPEEPDFTALPRLSRRGSTHTTVARGTALWESLVGKSLGKATDPLIHAKGSGTLLLQLERKAHVQAPTRDEDFLPWGDSRSTPRSMSALERNPQVPAPKSHKVVGPGIDG